MCQEFKSAADEIKTFKTEPSDDDKLVLYAYFKQVTVGDCNTGTKAAVVFKLNFSAHQFTNLSTLDSFNLAAVGSYP